MVLIPEFGAIITTKVQLKNGKEVKTRNQYEERVRVRTMKEESEHYLEWREKHRHNNKVEFRVEGFTEKDKNGFYYVVKCWEEVV